MTIRTQSLVSILPVFLFLAVVSSGLMLKTEREEYLWGLREEASSLAVATAEFLSAAEPGLLASGRIGTAGQPPGAGRVLGAIDRILGSSPGTGSERSWRRIYGLTADGQSVLFCRDRTQAQGPAPPGEEPLLPGAAEVAAIRRGELFALATRRGSRGRLVMTAYAPVRDASGNVAGLIGVETDAQGIETLTRGLIARSLLGIGAVLLLGAGATMAVSGVVSREVRDLRAGVARMKEGDLDVTARAGRIQEVGDLCSTLNTMNELLKDVLAKTKRSLLEGEQFREPVDLAQVFSEERWPPLHLRLGTVQVVARRNGGMPDGSFQAAFAVDRPAGAPSMAGAAADGVWALVGRVREESVGRTTLETVIAASAACSLLVERLRVAAPGQAIADVCELFPLQHLDVVCCRAGSVERWGLDGRGASAPDAEYLVLHTLGRAFEERIERYRAFFGCPDAAELLEEIAAIDVGCSERLETRGGCLMVVKTGELLPAAGG